MKKLIVFSLLLSGFMLPTSLFAETVTEEWVARYDGPRGPYAFDYARAIAVDTSGNVYVTGDSGGVATSFDYATVKYAAGVTPNEDGTVDPEWVARYNGPANGSDCAYAIAVDESGNIYVTGDSVGITTSFDYATVKYDSLGNELWVKRYDSPGNGYDKATAIAVDTSGNVYVTGLSSLGSTTYSYYDYATVKYDTDGNEQWVARYDGPANHSDSAYAIAVDTSGNVYVTGASYGIGTYCDYATVKYAPNGEQLWVARYAGPANSTDGAYAIAVDTSGNVYVTGQSIGSGRADYVTIKYDSDTGEQLWVARYDGPANLWGCARAIALDTSGNVYVTGESQGIGASYDYVTIKYDSDTGEQLWEARYDGPGNRWDYARAIAVDTSGNVYVTGYSSPDSSPFSRYANYATVKYAPNGNEEWVARYIGPGDYPDGRAYAIALDSSGNVYVTGWSWRPGRCSDYATIKYSQGLPIIPATIDIDPDTLNLKSKGNWITCYIELPEGYYVEDIDIDSVGLTEVTNDFLEPPLYTVGPSEIGDYDDDGISDLMVKFDRQELITLLEVEDSELTVSGELIDGPMFEGTDMIRVIDEGSKNN